MHVRNRSEEQRPLELYMFLVKGRHVKICCWKIPNLRNHLDLEPIIMGICPPNAAPFTICSYMFQVHVQIVTPKKDKQYSISQLILKYTSFFFDI